MASFAVGSAESVVALAGPVDLVAVGFAGHSVVAEVAQAASEVGQAVVGVVVMYSVLGWGVVLENSEHLVLHLSGLHLASEAVVELAVTLDFGEYLDLGDLTEMPLVASACVSWRALVAAVLAVLASAP